MTNRVLFLAAILLACFQTTFSQVGLPQWPLVTAAVQYLDAANSANTVPNQFVDWTATSPASANVPGTSSHIYAPTQLGVNGCNEEVFFVLHNGQTAQASSFLRLYTPAGVYMPLPGGDMNGSVGDDEVQVVRRPHHPNQWFVVYTMAPNWVSGGTYSSPGYMVNNLGYSLIEVNGTTASYVSDGLGPIQDRILDVLGTQYTYVHGKATSLQSVVSGFNHDIYVQRRNDGVNSFILDRFSINTGPNITYTGSSNSITSNWWTLTVAGSPIELSPNNQSVAVLVRTEVDDAERIFVFNTSSLTTAPDIITLCDLEIQFTSAPAPLTGTSHQATDFLGAPGTNFDWLTNFERKISAIEFSPNGNYLYIAGGGYVNNNVNNITYLGQIDLTTSITGNHPVRLQVESSDASNTYLTFGPASGQGETWSSLDYTNYWHFHGISNIEACYDGNFYFTKTNSQMLFSLPSPNSLLPINMTPHSVNMSTLSEPNISTNGYAMFMPDQIDGFNYALTNYTDVQFWASNNNMCSCDTLHVTVVNSVTGDTVNTFFIDDCPDSIRICVPSDTTLDFIGDNGVIFHGSIVNGTVVYPAGNNVFNFSSLGSNANFTYINSTNNYINQDQVWEGKYVIEANTILTVDNATLDLTNVDLIFGDCAGIDFINGANVRANNSVFRPCKIDGTWRGLQFVLTSGDFDNIINECTFKNAEIALFFDGNTDGVVSNNTFSNCNQGIQIFRCLDFNHPISDNLFVVDDFWPVFHNCYFVTSPSTWYGIDVATSTVSGEIAQNHFVYARDDDKLNTYGVRVSSGTSRISENTFTNLWQPIVISNAKNPNYIDNNEIEYNNDYITNAMSTAGIAVFSSNGVTQITNNIIHDNSGGDLATYGIYVSGSSGVRVRHNSIDGFSVGIDFYKCKGVEATENVLTEVRGAGIAAEEHINESMSFITCNDITMKYLQGSGIFESTNTNNQTDDNGLTIHSNCVKDADISIDVESSNSEVIPYIRNNYLYNYYSYGIYNDGHIGDIGTSSDPGLNTLWSNYNPAIDIASTSASTISVADNLGMFNISFPYVLITSGNPYHSTASCGQQIYNMPSQGNLNTSFVCDNSAIIYAPFYEELGKIMVDGLSGQISSSEAKLRTLIRAILSVTDLNATEVTNIINQQITDPNQKNLAFYYLQFRLGNYEQAAQYLHAYTPVGKDDAQVKELELIHLAYLQDNTMDMSGYVDMLVNLALKKGPEANLAADLLRFTNTHAPYPYHEMKKIEVDHTLKSTSVPADGASILAYPNPVHDMVTINVLGAWTESDANICITDVSGKKVKEFPIKFVAGQIKVDLSFLSAGVYFIALTGSEQAQTLKFVKD